MSAPSTPPEPHAETNRLRLDDPRSIRALAHPARLAILDALACGEELTATQCAELTGLSPSATAYHLKSLERFGYVEPAAARPDRRERPWRATRRRTHAYLDTSSPANASATAALAASYLDATRELFVAAIVASPEEPAQWRDASFVSTSDWWLTAEEVERIHTELEAVLAQFKERALASERPEGSRRVRAMYLLTPHPPTERDPRPGS